MTPNASLHNPSPEYIRALVERSGLSQREAAKRIGVSDRLLRYYLTAGADSRSAPYPVQFALEALAGEVTK